MQSRYVAYACTPDKTTCMNFEEDGFVIDATVPNECDWDNVSGDKVTLWSE